MKAKTILVVVLAVLTTIVLMQNQDEVVFKFLFWDLHLPKLVLMTGFIFVGIIWGLLMRSSSRKPTQVLNHDDEQIQDKPFDTLSREDRDYISD